MAEQSQNSDPWTLNIYVRWHAHCTERSDSFVKCGCKPDGYYDLPYHLVDMNIWIPRLESYWSKDPSKYILYK